VKTALIIDDDKDSIAIAEAATKGAGFETHLFASAGEAIRLAPGLHPQLILVEIKLGDALGFEVTRAVRKHPSLYHAEVVLMSNAGEAHDIEYGLQEGADSFLRKPFMPEEFSERITAMQRLREQVHGNCPTTGMASVLGLRREIDHLIFREEDFALCYLIPKGLSQLRLDKDSDRIDRAAQTTAQVIRSTIHNDGFYETFCCHLGSGHFMVKVASEDWKRFYKCVTGRFASAHGLAQNGAALPSPTLRFGAMLNQEGKRYRQSRDLFHDLRGSQHNNEVDTGIEKSKRLKLQPKKSGHNHWAG